MHVIDDEADNPNISVGREMRGVELLWSRVRDWAIRLRRRLPYLVWYGDEIDLTVTLKQFPLDTNAEHPFTSLFTGSPFEAAQHFRAMGIDFDTCCGPSGYDWEWDWSLKGPISCKFRGRTRSPEQRNAPPVPHLAVDNTAA